MVYILIIFPFISLSFHLLIYVTSTAALPGYESISSPATSSDDAATTTIAAAATKCEPRKGRGEIDMLILCRNHVIFCEVKMHQIILKKKPCVHTGIES